MASEVIKALTKERDELKDQIVTIEREHPTDRLPEDVKLRWNDLNKRLDEYETKIELRARQERVEEISRDEDQIERIEPPQVRRPGAVEGDLIYDLKSIVYDMHDPAATGREFHDRAKKAIERSEFPSDRISREDAQTAADRLLRDKDTEDGRLARHMLVTGSDDYKRAFGRYVTGQYLSNKERDSLEISRAMSLTGTSGGFAVPFELDPSIIPTSNLAINPYRSISRVVQISVDEWRGVSSAGITSAYAAEATAATDASPTLAQPTVTTEKARAFVPFSIEVGMDWPSLQAEMGGLLADTVG